MLHPKCSCENTPPPHSTCYFCFKSTGRRPFVWSTVILLDDCYHMFSLHSAEDQHTRLCVCVCVCVCDTASSAAPGVWSGDMEEVLNICYNQRLIHPHITELESVWDQKLLIVTVLGAVGTCHVSRETAASLMRWSVKRETHTLSRCVTWQGRDDWDLRWPWWAWICIMSPFIHLQCLISICIHSITLTGSAIQNTEEKQHSSNLSRSLE